MSNDLPTFRKTPIHQAENYAKRVFGEAFVAVIPQPGDYFQGVFASSYFVLQAGNTEPSKSQWNTLKKRMKRVNATVFTLKTHGEVSYRGATHYYMAFGFLSD